MKELFILRRVFCRAILLAAAICPAVSTVADEASKQRRPVSASIEVQADQTGYSSRMPDTLIKALESDLGAALSGSIININPAFGRNINPSIKFLQASRCCCEAAEALKLGITCSFSQLLAGSSEDGDYGLGVFLIRRDGIKETVIVTVEVKLAHPLESGERATGKVRWSGPYFGDWQRIHGFGTQDITQLLRFGDSGHDDN